MLVKLDITVAHALCIFVGNLRHHLSGLVHEVMLDKPLAYELLGELFLWLTLGEFLLIAVSIEVTAGVGGVYLVNEVYLAVTLAELIFRIYQDKTLLLGNLLTTGKELAGIVLHHGIVLGTDDTLCDDLFFRDVQVMTLVGFGGRSDDRLGETLVLLHALRQFHATQFTASVLILTPCTSCQDAADDHLHTEALTLQTYGDHGVGGSQFPVRTDVTGGIQELSGNLVEYLSLERNTLRQDDVKC